MSRAALVLSVVLAATVAGLVGLLAGGGGRTSTVPLPELAAAVGPTSFADVVQRVNPAVVHVTVIEDPQAEPPQEDEPEEPDDPRGGPRRGEGSGFIVDPQGHILTNHHVVADPERIRVRLADKRELPAVLVGSDASTDLALIKVDAAGLPFVPLGDSDRLRVGEWVCAIGNPYRFDHSVTVGVVSSKGRKIYDASFDSYIQTDAAINPGSSGGPLINAAGEAVGINAAVSVQGQGIGFAVPINIARDILEQLRTRGHVSRGYLGIQLHDIEPDLQRLMGLKEPRGALVVDVIDGSAGQAAGLRRYDVITAVSGQPIEDGDHLVRAIAARPPGSDVNLDVLRDGRPLTLRARLAERTTPARRRRAPQWVDERDPQADPLGLRVSDLSREAQAHWKIPEDRRGVVVREIVGLSPGLEALDHGDLIVEVNRQPTPTPDAYRRVVTSLGAGEPAWLYVYRPRGGVSFLAKLEADRR